MVAGKKEESLPYLLMLLSLLRPELQGYIKPEQAAPVIPVGGSTYNLTGAAFNSHPYSATSFNNYFFSSKEANAAANGNDPLSQYLNWPPNTQFNTSAIAMILGEPGPSFRLPYGDSESGYSSDEALSPLSAASYRSASPPYTSNDAGMQGGIPVEVTEPGATGFSSNGAFNPEDFVDLDLFQLVDQPNKQILENPGAEQHGVKQEPSTPTNKMCPQSCAGLSMGKSATNVDFTNPFSLDLGIGDKHFDPYSIDFETNQTTQFPGLSEAGTSVDIDSLIGLDFPLEILNEFQQEPANQLAQYPLDGAHNSRENDSGIPLPGNAGPVTSQSSTNPELPSFSQALQPLSDQQVSKARSVFKSNAGTSTSKGKKAVASKKVLASKADADSLDIGVSEEKIVEMSVAEFTTFLEKLSDAQAKYVRDVRRRGKNKEAARICRKRKMDAIETLDDEITRLKQQRQSMFDERKDLQQETAELKRKISELESSLFSSFRDDNGRPLSSEEYSLFQGSDGAVFLGKNIASKEKKKEKSS
uniref:Nuclear factor erythroid 2-related factor-like protein n=1 Tax=Nematostella vectensis TaxID=45351 RepID=A0A1C9KCX2_NEMVE|nr:nuclear factor erythroid 2-related factor-like protein [Nematostella vectensis]